jgi:hypothetical protein
MSTTPRATTKTTKRKPQPYLMVRVDDEQLAKITSAAKKAGSSYPAVWARTLLLQAAERVLAKT